MQVYGIMAAVIDIKAEGADMIPVEDVAALIKAEIPDAQVEVTDKTGMSDHFRIRVVSGRFAGVGLMDRHRMVMATLQPAMQDGRLHAAEIQTELPK